MKVGGFVFATGQGPFDPATGDIIEESIQEQARQCLRNIEAIQMAANCSLDNTVSATFILGEESVFAGMNEEWGKWFVKDPPARQGAKLPPMSMGETLTHAHDAGLILIPVCLRL